MTTVHRIAILNARVRTGNPRRPWADAVLVRDDLTVWQKLNVPLCL